MFAYSQRAPSPGCDRVGLPYGPLVVDRPLGAFDLHFERAFTLQEAADRLGISLRQAEMHVADGTLAAVNVGRGRLRRDLRVLDEELDRFVEARKVVPTRAAEAASGSRRRLRAYPAPQQDSFTEAYLNRSNKGRP